MAKHPLWAGAAYSKANLLQGIKRPSSEAWTGLATSMWIREALKDLPEGHPRREGLLKQLRENDKLSPGSSDAIATCHNERKDSGSLDAFAMKTCDNGDAPSNKLKDKMRTQTSQDVAPTISPCRASHTVFIEQLDEINTLTFDLRNICGKQDFQLWMCEPPADLETIHSVSFQHWTWIFKEESATWSIIDDMSVFSLLADGAVKVARNTGLGQQELCRCDGEPGKEEHEAEALHSWSIADFARAVAQDDTELLRLAAAFVNNIEEYDEQYETVCCRLCKLPMFFVFTARDRETGIAIAPESLRVGRLSPSTCPTPSTSAGGVPKVICPGYLERSDQQEDEASEKE